MTQAIHTEFIRLDTLLKLCNMVQSGGEAKHLIQEGFVLLNGAVCTMRGKKIVAGDCVTVGEQTITVIYEDEG